MPTDYIRYDLLVQEALRSVVRKVLGDAARSGLPGDHHFYISFKTGAPGVSIPATMRQKYPDEMTIILQHEFWDLTVSNEGFEVSLSFSRKPERLAIPFNAITGFSDPSVPTFGFKFMVPDVAEAGAGSSSAPAPVDKPREPPRKPAAPPPPAAPAPAIKPPAPSKSSESALTAASPAKPQEKADPGKVVSIDAFRKK